MLPVPRSALTALVPVYILVLTTKTETSSYLKAIKREAIRRGSQKTDARVQGCRSPVTKTTPELPEGTLRNVSPEGSPFHQYYSRPQSVRKRR